MLTGGDHRAHPFVKHILELEDRRQGMQRQIDEGQVEAERRTVAVRQALQNL